MPETEVVETTETGEADDGLQEGQGVEETTEGQEAEGEEVDADGDSEGQQGEDEGGEAAGEAEGEGGDPPEGQEGAEGSSEATLAPETVVHTGGDGDDWTLDDARGLIERVDELAALKQELDTQEGYLNQAIDEAKQRPADHLLKILVAREGSEDAGRRAMWDLGERLVADRMRHDGMTDEERRKEAVIAQAQRDRQELESYRQRDQQAKAAKVDTEANAAALSEIGEAMTAADLDSTNPTLVKEVAQKLLDAMEQGIPMKASRAVRLVKQSHEKRQAPDWDSLDVDSLPDSVKEKIRQADIERLRKDKTSGQDSDEGTAETAGDDESDPYNGQFSWRAPPRG